MINCIEAWRFDKYRNMSPRERDIVIQIAIHSNSKTEKANYMVDQLDSKLGESGHLWTCLYVADSALLQSSRLLWLTKSFSLKQNGHASYASEIIYCARIYLDYYWLLIENKWSDFHHFWWKMSKFKCDILGDFQKLWRSPTNLQKRRGNKGLEAPQNKKRTLIIHWNG